MQGGVSRGTHNVLRKVNKLSVRDEKSGSNKEGRTEEREDCIPTSFRV